MSDFGIFKDKTFHYGLRSIYFFSVLTYNLSLSLKIAISISISELDNPVKKLKSEKNCFRIFDPRAEYPITPRLSHAESSRRVSCKISANLAQQFVLARVWGQKSGWEFCNTSIPELTFLKKKMEKKRILVNFASSHLYKMLCLSVHNAYVKSNKSHRLQ